MIKECSNCGATGEPVQDGHPEWPGTIICEKCALFIYQEKILDVIEDYNVFVNTLLRRKTNPDGK